RFALPIGLLLIFDPVEELDRSVGQRVATPGDFFAVLPLDLHRYGVSPDDASLDAVVGAAYAAADLQCGQPAAACLTALLSRHDGSPCVLSCYGGQRNVRRPTRTVTYLIFRRDIKSIKMLFVLFWNRCKGSA